MDKQKPPLSDTETGRKVRETVVQRTGFEPADILEAPVRPPELKNVRPSFSWRQLLLIALGSVVAVFGISILLVYDAVFLGLLLALLGVLAVVAGALVRL